MALGTLSNTSPSIKTYCSVSRTLYREKAWLVCLVLEKFVYTFGHGSK